MVKKTDYAAGSAGVKALFPPPQFAHINGMEPVDILFGKNGGSHPGGGNVPGNRQLNQNAVYPVVGVQLLDELKDIGLGNTFGEFMHTACDPDLFAGALFGCHINTAGRVGAHHYHSKPRGRTGKEGYPVGDVCPYLLRVFLTGEDKGHVSPLLSCLSPRRSGPVCGRSSFRNPSGACACKWLPWVRGPGGGSWRTP